MKKENGYYVNRHSCFSLQYHLVLVTKYRHPVIANELKSKLLEYTENYFAKQDMNLLLVNTDKDHIHILFECSPIVNLPNFVNAFKSASSRQMRKQFPEFLSKYYCKPYFWSLSYFICTVSEHSTDLVKQYIANQGLDD